MKIELEMSSIRGILHLNIGVFNCTNSSLSCPILGRYIHVCMRACLYVCVLCKAPGVKTCESNRILFLCSNPHVRTKLAKFYSNQIKNR